jgi:multidrug efflux pump subunit AcrB
VSPNFWTDPTSGIPYYIAVQTPEPKVNSVNAVNNTPVSGVVSSAGAVIPGLLSNVATLQRSTVPTNTNQTNIQPIYDVYATVQGRDLGSVAGDINKIVAELQQQLSPGNSIQIAGQIQSMSDAFRDLGIGLLFAAVFVYLLMVVNYQNFGDPFVVILALPATLCGILTMLFITGTTLNVPSLMGAIMAIGVAVANAILLVTFAERGRALHGAAARAAAEGGAARLRAVLMTSGAMVAGMLPMALGFGEGAEQTAALARAVVGGVLVSTAATLFALPTVFALVQRRTGVASASLDPDDPNSRRYDVDRVQLFE